MKIEILGSGCAKCNRLTEEVKKTVAKMKVKASVSHVSDMGKILDYGVMMTPAVVIQGVVKSVGRIPSQKELTAWISEARDAL